MSHNAVRPSIVLIVTFCLLYCQSSLGNEVESLHVDIKSTLVCCYLCVLETTFCTQINNEDQNTPMTAHSIYQKYCLSYFKLVILWGFPLKPWLLQAWKNDNGILKVTQIYLCNNCLVLHSIEQIKGASCRL